MYRIAVCEDEPLMAEQNVNMTSRILDGWGLVCGRDYQIDVYHAPGPLLEQLITQPDAYHLLLLDIQLEGESGLELACFLREKRIRASVLYITAYQDRAGDAIHTYALDFLVKPVDEEKLARALDWDYRENFHPERPLLHIGDRAIPLEDIFCLEATRHKVAVHLADKQLFFPATLSGLEPELPPHSFCRSHFSFLVNLSHIREIKRTTLILDNGQEFPVSRGAYPTLVSEHISYMKKNRFIP